LACGDCYNALLLSIAGTVGSRYNRPAWPHFVPSASVWGHSASNGSFLFGHQRAISTEQPGPSQSRDRTEFGQRPVDRSRIADRFGGCRIAAQC
jgi:hypothetical protein